MTNTLHFFIESGKLMVMEHVPEEPDEVDGAGYFEEQWDNYEAKLQKAKQGAIEVDNQREMFVVLFDPNHISSYPEELGTEGKIYSLEGCKMETNFQVSNSASRHVALITFEKPRKARKIYGSTKEEPKKYPIGGYAPGSYACTCSTCEKQFMGDKRAVQCEPCAVKMTQFEEPKKEEIQEENDGWTLSREKMPDFDGFYYVYGFMHHSCGNVTPFHKIVECKNNQWVKSDIGEQMTYWRPLLTPPKHERNF